MILTVELGILLVTLAIQIILAIGAMWSARSLQTRFSFSLGSLITVADLLEKYNRVVSQVNIKVDAPIKDLPSKARPGLLLVNRSHVFSTDLYHNFHTVFQIILTRTEFQILHKTGKYQQGFFLMEVLFLILSLLLSPLFAIAGIIIGIGLIAFSFLLDSILRNVANEALEVGVDLLNLDKVEKGRAVQLAEKMRTFVFFYPISLVILVIKFFVPFFD